MPLYCDGSRPLLRSESAHHQATVSLLGRIGTSDAKPNPDRCLIYVCDAAADPASRWMPLRVKGQAKRMWRDSRLANSCLRPIAVRPTQGDCSTHAAHSD